MAPITRHAMQHTADRSEMTCTPGTVKEAQRRSIGGGYSGLKPEDLIKQDLRRFKGSNNDFERILIVDHILKIADKISSTSRTGTAKELRQTIDRDMRRYVTQLRALATRGSVQVRGVLLGRIDYLLGASAKIGGISPGDDSKLRVMVLDQLPKVLGKAIRTDLNQFNDPNLNHDGRVALGASIGDDLNAILVMMNKISPNSENDTVLRAEVRDQLLTALDLTIHKDLLRFDNRNLSPNQWKTVGENIGSELDALIGAINKISPENPDHPDECPRLRAKVRDQLLKALDLTIQKDLRRIDSGRLSDEQRLALIEVIDQKFSACTEALNKIHYTSVETNINYLRSKIGDELSRWFSAWYGAHPKEVDVKSYANYMNTIGKIDPNAGKNSGQTVKTEARRGRQPS